MHEISKLNSLLNLGHFKTISNIRERKALQGGAQICRP